MSRPRFPSDVPRNAGPVPVPRPVPVPLPPRNDPDPETTNRQAVYLAIGGLVLLFFLLLILFLSMQIRGSGTDSGTGAGNDQGHGANSKTDPGQDVSAAADSTAEERQHRQEDQRQAEDAHERREERKRQEEQEAAKEPETSEGGGDASEAGGQDSGTADEGEDTNTEESDGENGGSGLLGNQATVHFFNTKGKGRKFVFVVDRSGSMDGQPLQAAKEEIVRAFSRLDQRHELNIIAYNDHWVKWRSEEKLVPATTENKEEAAEFTALIASQGGTNHLPPLLAALECEPDIVFFLTDGQSLTASDLATVRAKSEGIRINVVHFSDGFGGDADVLERLATENRGQYKRIDMRDWDAL